VVAVGLLFQYLLGPRLALRMEQATETTEPEYPREAPDRDLREIDGGAEALFVAPVERSNLRDERDTLLNADLFPETHPPTEERIERLQALASEGDVGTVRA
jgi:heat shock protein HtpX